MGVFAVAFVVLLGVAGIGYVKLWYDQVTMRDEVRRLRATQDEIIDLVANTLIEDDSAREFLRSLKVGRERLPGRRAGH
jgi:hypothetical protein